MGWLERHISTSLITSTLVVLGFLCFVVVAVLVVWKVPQQQVPATITDESRARAELENEFRKTAAQIVVAAFVLIGATATGIGVYYTARRVRATERTVEVAQEQQITERFTRAIDQLGNDQSMAIRLGGIYALERIAKDSAKDHWQVMEVLTAYVRGNARWEGPIGDQPKDTHHSVPTDIQAILTVIGRRSAEYDPPDERLDLTGTDLRRANLENANLQGAVLRNANIQGALLNWANFQRAHLNNANLRRSHLNNTNLQMANLGIANLQQALLHGANLEGAILFGANLQGAMLTGANFQGADLSRANLSGATGLSQEQINSAHIDEHTILPDYLKREE